MHVRVAPEAVTGSVTAGIILRGLTCCTMAMALGCSRGSVQTAIAWTIDPPAPIAGSMTTVALALTSRDGAQVSRATLHLEGHMSHPGMAPIVADLVERQRGTYEAQLQFTMAGDWVLVASGALADGSRITHDTRISVRPAPAVHGAAPTR
jgi:hypothetical protein